MKLQEKIKSWCKDEKFMSFAQERARKEVCEVAENHRIDPQYEELDEAFEYDDRYIALSDVPNVQAASCPAAAERW